MLFLILCWLFLIPVSALAQDVKITNFSSNSLPEWVELTNQTAGIIDIDGWTLKDSNSSSSDDITLSGCLSGNSTIVLTHEDGWLNNDGDSITLLDKQGTQIDTLTYTTGKILNQPASSNTCVPTATPTVPSNTPSPTQTLTPTKTPTPNPTNSPTNSPTNTPVFTNTPTKTPTPTLRTSPTPTEKPQPTDFIDNPPTPTLDPNPTPTETLLEIGDITVTPVPQKNKSYAGLISFIFMGLGGVLLLVPLFIYLKK